ncbi:RNA polymerase sigma factor, partial [Planctomycetota bacterium]
MASQEQNTPVNVQNLRKILEDLYDDQSDQIYTYCLAMSGSEYMAEECTQEVFYSLFRNPEFLDKARRFKAYLYKVVRNKLIRMQAEAKTGRSLKGSANELPARKDPEVSADMDQVMEALHELPAGQKDVILLRLYQGLTYREIA